MTDTANRLDQLMREQLPEGGYVVPGGRALFMEVIDTATGEVWMSAAPVQQTAPALPGGPMEISVNKALWRSWATMRTMGHWYCQKVVL